MSVKPFRRALVLALLVLFAGLAPVSVAAARPLADGDREVTAGAPRPVLGFWTLMVEVVERLVGVFAADVGSEMTTTSGCMLDPNGTRSDEPVCGEQ